MLQISSTNNQTIKNLVKLQQKKYRLQTQNYLIEGYHLIQEALKSNQDYLYILGTKEALEKLASENDLDLTSKKFIQINAAITRHLSETKNSQSIFMVLKMNQPKNFTFSFGKWVILDNLSDPGNVGTIIRTADAAGFTGVIFSKKSVDLYNPKVQRAMQGSQFHITILQEDSLIDTITNFKSFDIPVYASVLDKQAKKMADFKPVSQLALIIGNEAHGISDEIAGLADEKIYIPIYGKAESLNAAVAAGIMIYHFA